MSSPVDGNAKEAADLLVLGGDVITMDTDRRVIRGGAIAARDGKITWIGTTADARQRFEASPDS